MKLTKLQRHTAYILMQDGIENDYKMYGFCIWIQHLFGIVEGFHNKETVIRKYFPELWRKRPKAVFQKENENQGCLWFNYYDSKSNTKRVELLKQCIEETY
jgi:hypothetical protein